MIVAEQIKDDKAPKEIPMFKLHPLTANQRLSKVRLSVPTVFSSSGIDGYPPDQQISLWPIKTAVAEYHLKQLGRKPGFSKIVFTSIPVIFDATYTASGVMRRGLYSLEVELVIGDKELPDVTFKDFNYVQALDLNSDPQKLLDDLLKKTKTLGN